MLDMLCNFVQQEYSDIDPLSNTQQHCNYHQENNIFQYNNPVLTETHPPLPGKTEVSYSTKIKRSRSNYTASQVDEFEKFFEKNMYPDRSQRSEIAERLHINEQQVRVWFQNRRTKQRRLHLGLNKKLKELDLKSSHYKSTVDDQRLLYSKNEWDQTTTDFGDSIVHTLNTDFKTPEKNMKSEARTNHHHLHHQETRCESDFLNISDVMEIISEHELNTRRSANSTAYDHHREEMIERIKRDLELSVQEWLRVAYSSGSWNANPIPSCRSPAANFGWTFNANNRKSTSDGSSF